jgi:hypothetical protein
MTEHLKKKPPTAVARLIAERAPDYETWFRGSRTLRNQVKEGVDVSGFATGPDVGASFVGRPAPEGANHGVQGGSGSCSVVTGAPPGLAAGPGQHEQSGQQRSNKRPRQSVAQILLGYRMSPGGAAGVPVQRSNGRFQPFADHRFPAPVPKTPTNSSRCSPECSSRSEAYAPGVPWESRPAEEIIMGKSKRVALYARVSTDSQTTENQLPPTSCRGPAPRFDRRRRVRRQRCERRQGTVRAP